MDSSGTLPDRILPQAVSNSRGFILGFGADVVIWVFDASPGAVVASNHREILFILIDAVRIRRSSSLFAE